LADEKENVMNTKGHARVASLAAMCALIVVASNGGERTADARTEPSAPQAERPTNPPRDDNAAHPTMHITGCIERGVIAGSFVLTQVEVAGTKAGAGSTVPGESPGTRGHADDRAMAGERADAHAVPARTYTLRSLERGSDLGQYIGKRVAVTGRLTADRDQTGLGTRGTTGGEASSTPNDTTRSDRPGGTSAAGAAAAAANVRQLDADSIRAVAGTCTPPADRR
jgi:hypothetical protein